MTLEAQFQDAAVRVKNLTERPSNQDLLDLYALYKQGSEGDVSGEKPGMFDFKAAAKYNAWEKLKGTASEEAMQQYIAKVEELIAKHG